MTNGTSQGLFVIVAVVIFGIFVGISYFLFKDNMKPSLANIFEESILFANRSLNNEIDNNGGDNNENNKEEDVFLTNSELEVKTQASYYMGRYINWKYDPNDSSNSYYPETTHTKSIKSGDDYIITNEVDMSQFMAMKGTVSDINDWSGLSTQTTVHVKLSDEDKKLVDFENPNINEESDGYIKIYNENGDYGNITAENRELNQEYSLKMKDGSTKKIIIKWKAVNNPHLEGSLEDNYKFDWTYNFKIVNNNTGESKNISLDYKGGLETQANIVVDSKGFVNSGIENYSLIITSVNLRLNNVNDYFIFGLNDERVEYNSSGEYKLMDYETNLGISEGEFTPNTVSLFRQASFTHNFKLI